MAVLGERLLSRTRFHGQVLRLTGVNEIFFMSPKMECKRNVEGHWQRPNEKNPKTPIIETAPEKRAENGHHNLLWSEYWICLNLRLFLAVAPCGDNEL